MHIINLFSKSVLATSLLMMSALSFAHNGEDHSAKSTTTAMPMDHSQMNHAEMKQESMDHSQMNHSQHQTTSTVNPNEPMQDGGSHQNSHQNHHRKEHGAQIYAVTTVDNKWLMNEDGVGALKSEFETRIGTDENKIFIKFHADKEESHDAHYDAKF